VTARWKSAVISIAINCLLSWALLPLAMPPFRRYSLRELGEVLLWQGMGAVGWPLALLGGVANLLFQGRVAGLAPLLFVAIYPLMLLLLVVALASKRFGRWALIALHLLITFSFAAVWYRVLNGYDFMVG
jgi:hypothetical protein